MSEETTGTGDREATPPEGSAGVGDSGSRPEGGPAPEAEGEGWKVEDEKRSPWLAQLQSMIDEIAEVAAPIARDVAAKAAELTAAAADRAGPTAREFAARAADLAALAGERAGPIAYKAAGVTQDVGTKIAERGHEVAADLRRPPEEGAGPEAEAGAAATGGEETVAPEPAGAVGSAEPPAEAVDESAGS